MKEAETFELKRAMIAKPQQLLLILFVSMMQIKYTSFLLLCIKLITTKITVDLILFKVTRVNLFLPVTERLHLFCLKILLHI